MSDTLSEEARLFLEAGRNILDDFFQQGGRFNPNSPSCKSCRDPIPHALRTHTRGYCLSCAMEIKYGHVSGSVEDIIAGNLAHANQETRTFYARPERIRAKIGSQRGG